MKSNLLAIAALAGAFLLPQVASADIGLLTPTSSAQTAPFAEIISGSFDYTNTFSFTSNALFTETASSTHNTILGGGVSFLEVELWDLTTNTLIDDAAGTSSTVGTTTTLGASLGGVYSANSTDTYEIELIGSTYDTTGSFSGNIQYIEPKAPVPEPEQIAMFLLGLPLVSWFARRKQAA